MAKERAASKNPKVAKVRKNVMLSQDAISQGEALAKLDRRSSFSNMLEALLNKEHARQFPNGESVKAAA